MNGRERVRLDPDAMRETARSLGVPRGTRVYLEEGGVEFGFSAQTAFVQGYNFGLWRGVLAAEEFDVRVVSRRLGKPRSVSSLREARRMIPSPWLDRYFPRSPAN